MPSKWLTLSLKLIAIQPMANDRKGSKSQTKRQKKKALEERRRLEEHRHMEKLRREHEEQIRLDEELSRQEHEGLDCEALLEQERL